MKNYSIKMLAVCTVVVMQAKSEEEAIKAAMEDTSSGDFSIEEATCEGVIDKKHLEMHKRHADYVSEP